MDELAVLYRANTMVMHPSTMGQGAVEDLAHQGVLSQVSLCCGYEEQ